MSISDPQQPLADAHVPSPPSERGAWLTALALGVVGVVVLAVALLALRAGTSPRRPQAAAPAVPVAAVTPAPSPAQTDSVLAHTARVGRHHHAAHGKTIVARPTSAQQQVDASRFVDQTQTHIATHCMEGFYRIYAVAQRTFGVNWLLLASIHRQESAFSTEPSTYHGLNFAGCCGGPMQFNVTNGPVSTWQLMRDSYRYGRRPTAYDHMMPSHPSLYDDFDSIMAAAHLLSANGASFALDAGAWGAAYDYYGHDATGITYADQVLARAISWSQHGFCANCGTDSKMVEAVHAAYGAPVLGSLGKAKAARVDK